MSSREQLVSCLFGLFEVDGSTDEREIPLAFLGGRIWRKPCRLSVGRTYESVTATHRCRRVLRGSCNRARAGTRTRSGSTSRTPSEKMKPLCSVCAFRFERSAPACDPGRPGDVQSLAICVSSGCSALSSPILSRRRGAGLGAMLRRRLDGRGSLRQCAGASAAAAGAGASDVATGCSGDAA